MPSAFSAVTDLVASVAVGRSVRSRSANAIEPLSLSVVPSRITPPTSVAVIVGTSLVPVINTVTSWVAVPPLPSATVIVNTAVTTSPLARKSRLASVIV